MANKKSLKCKTKKQPSSSKLEADSNNENKFDIAELKDIAEATNIPKQSIFVNICRLCEGQDGPFVEMFNAQKTLAKKIDEIMPFVITENDDLPQQVCFRCSAKVEEVYEFVQRCVKTQESFDKTLGRNVMLKKKYRSIWEDKLNQYNISNDDICNAQIQKAIEKIKNTPKISIEKSCIEENADVIQYKVKSIKKVITENIINTKDKLAQNLKEDGKKIEIGQTEEKLKEVDAAEREVMKTNKFSLDSSNVASEELTKPFNIMDHVSKIKVNGVGDLFQCKICNRNFLIKAVVLNHRCAKSGGKGIAKEQTLAPVPPKIPHVKYINLKTQNETNSSNNTSKQIISVNEDDSSDKCLQPKVPKRRIGPASKVKQFASTASEPQKPLVSQDNLITQEMSLVTGISTSANLNSKYKFILGPKNSLVLVDDKPEQKPASEPTVHNVTFDKINNLQSLTVKSVSSKLNSATEIPTANTNRQQPYPVRLIISQAADKSLPSRVPEVTPPATNKQPYTVLQTDNPSKLLISKKPQPTEVPEKPPRQTTENNSVSKNPNKFTFVNVNTAEPGLYGLPTRNVVQESQVSTTIKSAPENKYSCNICGARFTLDILLFAHIKTHYNQFDEDDRRNASNKRKR